MKQQVLGLVLLQKLALGYDVESHRVTNQKIDRVQKPNEATVHCEIEPLYKGAIDCSEHNRAKPRLFLQESKNEKKVRDFAAFRFFSFPKRS
jgi:hypothetical protein